MLNLRQKTIYFCGKDRHFRDCSQEELIKVTEDAEGIIQEMQERVAEFQEISMNSQKYRGEAQDLLAQREGVIELQHKVLNIPEVGIAEIDRAEKYKKEAEKLKKEADKQIKLAEEVEAGLEDKTEAMQEYMKETNKKLIEEYGKACSVLLEDFKPEDFISNYNRVDMVIAENIARFYDMYMAGIPDSKIKKLLQELVEAKYEEKSFQ